MEDTGNLDADRGVTIKGTNIYKDLAVIIDNASHERIIGVINQGIYQAA